MLLYARLLAILVCCEGWRSIQPQHSTVLSTQWRVLLCLPMAACIIRSRLSSLYRLTEDRKQQELHNISHRHWLQPLRDAPTCTALSNFQVVQAECTYLHSTFQFPACAVRCTGGGDLLSSASALVPAQLALGGFAGTCPTPLGLGLASWQPSSSCHAPVKSQNGLAQSMATWMQQTAWQPHRTGLDTVAAQQVVVTFCWC